MKIGMAALVLVGGFVLLPGATVVPCVEAAARDDQAAAALTTGTEEDDAAALPPVCDPVVPMPTGFMLPAGGALASVLVALNSKSNTLPVPPSVTTSTISTN